MSSCVIHTIDITSNGSLDVEYIFTREKYTGILKY